MEYKVGSLADLISGSSTKKSKRVDSGERIIFQSEAITRTKQKRKKGIDIVPDVQSEKTNRKRNAEVDSHNFEHRKKKRRRENALNDNSGFISSRYSDGNLNNTGSNDTASGRYQREKEKQEVQESSVSQNVKNAQKRLLKKEKKNKPQHPFDEEKESRTVFVKNLPVSFKKSKVCKLFERFGPIQSTRFRCVALSDPRIPKKVAVIKGKFHPDRSNICAFICFQSQESANKALTANGMVVADHHILVDRAIHENTNVERRARRAVFVGNLPFAAEEDDLWKLFEGCGTILDIRIIRDKNTGIGKGFAYVNFESPDAVELALKLDGEKLKNRELRIARCSRKPKIAGVKKSLAPRFRTNSKAEVITQKKKRSLQQKTTYIPYEDQNKRSKDQESLKEKEGKPQKIKFQGNADNSLTTKKSQFSSYQGQTMFDKKKKKHKKKLTKEELKRKIVLKKLGIKSSVTP